VTPTTVVNIYQEFNHLTTDLIGLVAFGHNFDSLTKGSEYEESLAMMASGVDQRINVPKLMWRWVLKDDDKFLEALRKLKEVPREVLNSRKNFIGSKV
jgi:hypothetical protein